MFKKFVLPAMTFIAAMIMCFSFVAPLQAALETQLLVDVSPSSDNSPYNQTHWYGFTALASKGYCAILKPSTGNPNLYLFDRDFNLRTSSKNTGLTADKAWYGDSVGGVFHLGAHGAASPSSTYTIQVTTAPYVASISPTSGGVGTLVTINGYGFEATQGSNYVNFGSVKATSYSSWTNTQIKVYVPSGVASGTLQVVVYMTSIASNALNFTNNSLSSNGTMWRADLARTANYANGPIGLPLSLKWSYSLGETSYSKLIVANSSVYINAIGRFYAFDGNSGTIKWSYPTNVYGHSVIPSVAGDKVYSAAYDTFYAWDANTGALKWKYVLPLESYSQTTADDGSPAINNGVVYFVARASSTSTLYALDANTGVLKWSYKFTKFILPFPTIANNVVYISSYSQIYAFDASNGSLKWTYSLPTNKSMNGTMAFSNGILYFGTTDAIYGGVVYALDANTLSLRWQFGTSGWYYNPAVVNGKVYCYGTNNLGYSLQVLDANTGQALWANGYLAGESYQSPTVSRGIIYAVGMVSYTSNSRCYAFDANTGAVKWSYEFSGKGFETSAEPCNGKIYFTTSDGYLYCFGQ
jgi:outer membrane protein assembly factor BamB